MTKHTPGPWEWKEVPLPGLGPNRWCEVLNSAGGVAVVRHESSDGPTPWRINPANRRLIAAAPDLLVALRDLLMQPESFAFQAAARAAIAKAEWRS